MATEQSPKASTPRDIRKEERAQRKAQRQGADAAPERKLEQVIIIGGGIAGMEATKQLLSLGYRPVLVEKEDHLGGHVASWNRPFPDMGDA